MAGTLGVTPLIALLDLPLAQRLTSLNAYGTFEKCQRTLRMSANRGRSQPIKHFILKERWSVV
jgi:hypothetical protein